MAGQHATRSPSGAHGWLVCGGWVSDPVGSVHADEGTAAHELASRALSTRSSPQVAVGGSIKVGDRVFEIDADMAGHVQRYVDLVRSVPGELLVEQRLPIGHVTLEEGAHGTSDAVILRDDEIVVVDLKYGQGVEVHAEENPQLMLYALGALEAFGFSGDFKQVRCVISQPRLGHESEWTIDVPALQAWGETVRARSAQHAAGVMPIVPGEKQCRWCAKKATCEALAKYVRDQIGADFEDLTKADAAAPVAEKPTDALASALAAVDLVEDWCRAVRAESERRLLAGQPVPGFKLVLGRRGARAWTSAEQAEQMLKAFRLKDDQIYDRKVISPTTAEKLAKAEAIGKRQWPKLAALIVQPEGKPSVAPAADPRPPYEPPRAADSDFAPQPETAEDLV